MTPSVATPLLLQHTAKLVASDGALGDNFGYSVAIDGDTIVVGARYDDDKGSNSGSVYVFGWNGGTSSWSQQQKLTASDGASSDYFGFSVAISGDVIVVGVYSDDDKGTDSGLRSVEPQMSLR